MERVLVVKEAADYLRVNPQTVLRWVREGRLQAFRSGRHLVFSEESLKAFLEPVGSGSDA
jgi:excisionase family DNA binding protein